MSLKTRKLNRLYNLQHKLYKVENNAYARFVYDDCNGSDNINSNINTIDKAISKISKSKND